MKNKISKIPIINGSLIDFVFGWVDTNACDKNE